MRIEQHIVSAWATQLADKIIKDAIHALTEMDSTAMLSGDSGLKNVWEEVCVQVQDEQSFFWDMYVETMESLLAGYVDLLDRDARLALWTSTDEGWSYLFDHRDEEEGVDDVPVTAEEIVLKLHDQLLSAAADFENPRIAKFIARHEDGYDELEDEDDDGQGDEDDDTSGSTEDDVSDDESESQQTSTNRLFDLRPGVTDPVYFVISRQQVETFELESSLDFLRSLVPTKHPEHAWAHKGRLSLVISGYDADPRELFEIPEVCRYLRELDKHWPFWLFFLNQVDESIKVVAMCLASTVEVVPGAAHIDPSGLEQFMKRAFAAVDHLFENYGFPESENEALSERVMAIFVNSTIEPGRDGYNLD